MEIIKQWLSINGWQHIIQTSDLRYYKGDTSNVYGFIEISESEFEKHIKKVEKKISCHSCQGGGCPACNGYGYYYAD